MTKKVRKEHILVQQEKKQIREKKTMAKYATKSGTEEKASENHISLSLFKTSKNTIQQR